MSFAVACCAQMDFYEASQLHLSHSASIKAAEATVVLQLHLDDGGSDRDRCSHKHTAPKSHRRRRDIVVSLNEQCRKDEENKENL